MSTLVIAVNDSTQPYTFTKSGGPANATVATNGDIDLTNCAENNIGIQWNLDSGTFRSSGNSAPVTISGNGNDQIFTGGTLSNSNKTYTVTDANATQPINTNFNYTIHENGGDDDPIIRNRV